MLSATGPARDRSDMRSVLMGVAFGIGVTVATAQAADFRIPGTGQRYCYDAERQISCPTIGQPFFGQDGNLPGPDPRYADLGGGVVLDERTGLMWSQAVWPEMTWEQARQIAPTLRLGSYADWRLPTVKELYSLIRFDGWFSGRVASSIPFIDHQIFAFQYGPETAPAEAGPPNRPPSGPGIGHPPTGPGQRGGAGMGPPPGQGMGPPPGPGMGQGNGPRPANAPLGMAGAAGKRAIDVQLWTATEQVGRVMHNERAILGVNFADGRIKSYPLLAPGRRDGTLNRLGVRFVRGATGYGEGRLTDNGDGTVTDQGSGLVWQQIDDGETRNWRDALGYCQGLTLAGLRGWRLPNAKELQTIVDYQANPSVTGRAAIRAPLQVSREESYFWSSTTHLDGPEDRRASQAVYVAFGRALGWLEMPPGSGDRRLVDVHGAGAQRSDPKDGDPTRFAQGRGPQGDEVRIFNFARCVRGPA